MSKEDSGSVRQDDENPSGAAYVKDLDRSAASDREFCPRYARPRACPARTPPPSPPSAPSVSAEGSSPVAGWPEHRVLFPEGVPHLRPKNSLAWPPMDSIGRQDVFRLFASDPIASALKAAGAILVPVQEFRFTRDPGNLTTPRAGRDFGVRGLPARNAGL